MAQPLTSPDPTTIPLDQSDPMAGGGDKHVESLRKAYDKTVATVQETPPNTPEYHRAREAKKAAFLKWKAAADAKVKTDVVVAQAEQKQAAAESAARDAKAAQKEAAAVLKQHGVRHAAAAESEADVPGTSPVAGDNATDAADKVSRMTSKEKVQAVIDSDKRSTVVQAAQARLAQL